MSARKKVRPGKLELAADGCALEVYYESLEVAVLPSGEEAAQSTKQGIKRLSFQIPEDGDLHQLAQRIVDDCKLLHPQRLAEVEQLLEQAWQQRLPPPPAESKAASSLDAQHRVSDLDRHWLWGEQQRYLEDAAASATQALAAAAGKANIERLDAYLEEFYEDDLRRKTAAAAAVAHLFRHPRSLGPLQAHPTLLQALARLLREDAKRSAELCISLLMVFFTLSHVPQAHGLLLQNQVGSLTMDLLDLELRRAERWQQQEGVVVGDVGAKLLAGDILTEPEQRLALALARQEPLLYVGLSLLLNMAEDVAVEQKMVKKGLLRLLAVLLDRGSPQLLVLITTFLRKLSVFAENSIALRDAEVVSQLALLVPGPAAGIGPIADDQLVSSVLRLLHNLSFDEDMRQQMVAAGLIGKVAALLKKRPKPPSRATSGKSEQQPAQAVEQQQAGKQQRGEGSQLQQLVLGLLYHMSLQAKNRSMFLYTDAISALHSMLMAAEAPLATSCPDLAALMISLACSTRVAEEMARGDRLDQLLARALRPADPAATAEVAIDGVALQRSADPAEDTSPLPAVQAEAAAEAEAAAPEETAAPDAAAPGAPPSEAPAEELAAASWGPLVGDELLWKLLRALAQHDSEAIRACFAPTLPRMARLVMGGSLPPAVFVEALGCLSCLEIPDYDYRELLEDTQLPAFLAELAAAGGSTAKQDDVLLQVVRAAGVLCADEACAGMLVAAGLVDTLYVLMLERMEDDAFVLATTASAARLMAQGPTRSALLVHAELVARFAELLEHPLREVARAADAALGAIAGSSAEWATSVQRLRFETHNREWLQIIREEEAAAAALNNQSGGPPSSAASSAESSYHGKLVGIGA